MSEPDSYRYDAFISYRHVEPDRKWAKWLHRALETFKTPKQLVAKGIASRIRRVFRDEDELPASAHLSKEIDKALEQSRFLIVVCSPRTPDSEWVNQEVVRFRELGRHDQILALLVEGEPAESFPRALCEIRTEITDERGAVQEHIEDVEPLAADVRETREDSLRVLKRMALLRFTAALLGCRFDDLRQREQERRTRRLAWTSGAALVLAAIMAGLTVFALSQSKRAATAEVQAIGQYAALLEDKGRQELLAGYRLRALAYLLEAARLGRRNDALDLMLADALKPLEAELRVWTRPTGQLEEDYVTIQFEGEGRLLATGLDGALWKTADLQFLGRPAPGNSMSATYSRDGTEVAWVTEGRIHVAATESGEQRRSWEFEGSPSSAHVGLRWSPDGSRMLVNLRRDSVVKGQRSVRAYDVRSGKYLRTLAASLQNIRCEFSPSGQWIAIHLHDPPQGPHGVAPARELVLIDAVSLEPTSFPHTPGDGVTAYEFHPTRPLILTQFEQHASEIRIQELPAGRVVGKFTWPAKQSRIGSHWTEDGLAVVAIGADDTVQVLRERASRDIWELAQVIHIGRAAPEEVTYRLGAASSSRLVTFGDQGTSIWSLTSSPPRRALILGYNFWQTLFDSSGRFLICAVDEDRGEEGDLHVYDPSSGREIGRLEGHRNYVYWLDPHPHEPLLTSSGQATARLWNLEHSTVESPIHPSLALARLGHVSASRRRAILLLKTGWLVWDFANRARVGGLRGDSMRPLALSGNGEWVVAQRASDSKYCLTHAEGRHPIRVLPHGIYDQERSDVSSDGNTVVLYKGESLQVLALVESTTGREIIEERATGSSARFNSRGSHLLIWGSEEHGPRSARVFAAGDGSLVAELQPDSIEWVWTGDGDHLVGLAAAGESRLLVWSLALGRVVREILLPGQHPGRLAEDLLPDPHGSRIGVFTEDRVLTVWDSVLGTRVFQAPARLAWAAAVRTSSDGRWVVCTDSPFLEGADDVTRLWDAKTGALMLELPGVARAEFVAGDRLLIATSEHGIAPGVARLRSLRLETRSYEALAEFVGERLPYKIKDGRLVVR